MFFSLKNIFSFCIVAFTSLIISGAQKSQRKPVFAASTIAKPLAALQLKQASETFGKKSGEKIEAETSEGKPASAHASKLTHKEVFESIQEVITQSHCRVKDWKTFDSLDYTHKVLQTNCYTSARYLVCALTQEKDADLLNRYVDLSETDASLSQKFKQSEKLLDTEFYGLHTDFTTKGKSKGIGDCLFTAANKPEHLLFYVAPNPWKHAYVIQKLSDGKATRWKVYQSFFQQFSLAEWMGIDPWNSSHISNCNLTLLHQRYGNAKVLTDPLEVRRCVKDHFLIAAAPLGQKDSLYVRMFTVQ